MRKTAVFIAFAALTAGPALAALSAADKTFATEAAQGGQAEVEMGQLAERHRIAGADTRALWDGTGTAGLAPIAALTYPVSHAVEAYGSVPERAASGCP